MLAAQRAQDVVPVELDGEMHGDAGSKQRSGEEEGGGEMNHDLSPDLSTAAQRPSGSFRSRMDAGKSLCSCFVLLSSATGAASIDEARGGLHRGRSSI